MTQYEPLINDQGKTVGSYFIGFQISESMQSLKSLIRNIKVGKTGFLFIIDGSGNAMVHPHQEGMNLKTAKAADGREIIREMIEKKEGVLNYLWKTEGKGEATSIPMTSTLAYYKPWDWIIGASINTHEMLEESTRNRTVLIWVALLGSIAVSIFAHLLIRHSLVPIAVVIGEMERIGQGKVNVDVDHRLRQRKDELGTLGRAMQTMVENLRSLLRNITNVVQTLAGASTNLSSVSVKTSLGVMQVSNRANSVAAATEEASNSTMQVAQNMNETTKNLSFIADATSQLSSTIHEISGNSEKARSMTDQANIQAQSISSLMQQLGNRANEIGKVTESITHISAQTNLLALNATIEAARAGAAGKGFVVVANEIKELAQQTATATEDIKEKISGVQNSTGGAIANIHGISNIIAEVVQIVSNIATAIEQQSAMTKDLAENIKRTSSGVHEASDRVGEAATVSTSIAKEVSELNNAVADIRLGGQQVEANAEELKKLAEKLTKLTQRFNV
jgi:methyl-accepting chemotaxis protein